MGKKDRDEEWAPKPELNEWSRSDPLYQQKLELIVGSLFEKNRLEKKTAMFDIESVIMQGLARDKYVSNTTLSAGTVAMIALLREQGWDIATMSHAPPELFNIFVAMGNETFKRVLGAGSWRVADDLFTLRSGIEARYFELEDTWWDAEESIEAVTEDLVKRDGFVAPEGFDAYRLGEHLAAVRDKCLSEIEDKCGSSKMCKAQIFVLAATQEAALQNLRESAVVLFDNDRKYIEELQGLLTGGQPDFAGLFRQMNIKAEGACVAAGAVFADAANRQQSRSGAVFIDDVVCGFAKKLGMSEKEAELRIKMARVLCLFEYVARVCGFRLDDQEDEGLLHILAPSTLKPNIFPSEQNRAAASEDIASEIQEIFDLLGDATKKDLDSMAVPMARFYSAVSYFASKPLAGHDVCKHIPARLQQNLLLCLESALKPRAEALIRYQERKAAEKRQNWPVEIKDLLGDLDFAKYPAIDASFAKKLADAKEQTEAGSSTPKVVFAQTWQPVDFGAAVSTNSASAVVAGVSNLAQQQRAPSYWSKDFALRVPVANLVLGTKRPADDVAGECDSSLMGGFAGQHVLNETKRAKGSKDKGGTGVLH